MSQLVFTPLEKEYHRLYCPRCVASYLTKLSDYEDLYCPDCHQSGIKQKLIFTVLGEKNVD